VRDRVAAAAVLDLAEVAQAESLREKIRARMLGLAAEDTILVLPTAPGMAPLRNTPEQALDVFRARALELLCPAGHAGLPQISMPFGMLEGCPIGLPIIAARNCDEDLLDLATVL
jgi:amidase